MEDNKEGTALSVSEEEITVPDKTFDPNKHLRSDLWSKMSLNDLWLQKILLQQRIDFANQMGNIGLKEQMERGMKMLQVYIEEKSKSSEAPSVFL